MREDAPAAARVGDEAATADEAIKIAIRDYGITDPERQRRLVAQRVETRSPSPPSPPAVIRTRPAFDLIRHRHREKCPASNSP